MKWLFYFFQFFIFSYSIQSFGQTALENFLKTNKEYKSATEKLESSEWFKVGTQKVEEFASRAELPNKESETKGPTEQAELLYQGNVSSKPCLHCPEYLKLIKQVNKIVEEMPADKKVSVHDHNENIIQLNNLKFMYFATREITESGVERCQRWNNTDIMANYKMSENTKLLAEEVLQLPQVVNVQYMPGGSEKDIFYYYRGVGAQSNVLIEVQMKKDGEARLRYYRYNPSRGSSDSYLRLPDLGGVEPKKEDLTSAGIKLLKDITGKSEDKKEEKTGDYFNLKFGVKTRNLVIPTDVELVDAGKELDVAQGLKLKSRTNLAINEQATSISLANSTGSDWVRLEAINKTQSETIVTTTLPMELELKKESDLKFGGAIKREIVKDFNKTDKDMDTKDSVVLGLTDRNHEYFKAEVVTKNKGFSNLSVTSKLNLGDYGNISGKYERSNDGTKSYSLGKETDMGMAGKLTTRYGVTSEQKHFMEFDHEKKINKDASMVLSVKTGQGQPTTLMYQLKAKF